MQELVGIANDAIVDLKPVTRPPLTPVEPGFTSATRLCAVYPQLTISISVRDHFEVHHRLPVIVSSQAEHGVHLRVRLPEDINAQRPGWLFHVHELVISLAPTVK